jgi:hypothetical protein
MFVTGHDVETYPPPWKRIAYQAELAKIRHEFDSINIPETKNISTNSLRIFNFILAIIN